MNMGKAFDANDMRPKKRLPVAEERGKTTTMILVHQTLSDSDIPDVVKTVFKKSKKLKIFIVK